MGGPRWGVAFSPASRFCGKRPGRARRSKGGFSRNSRRNSVSPFEHILVIPCFVIFTLAEARAKGLPQIPDLVGLHHVVSGREAAQVPVAQLCASLKVRRDGFLGDLLPRDIDEEFLQRDGVGAPLAERHEREVRRSGFAAGAAREDRFRLLGLLQIVTQFPRVPGACERGLRGDGGIKVHETQDTGRARLWSIEEKFSTISGALASA